MPSWWDGQPFAVSVFALWVVATLRGQATYFLARYVITRLSDRPGKAQLTESEQPPWKIRLARWVNGPGVDRGRQALERWGWPLIAFCYLTVGFQTLVLAASGAMRVRWMVFSAAQFPGAVAWAFIYTTIGFAAWTSTRAYPVVGGVMVVLLLGVIVIAKGLRRRPRS